MKTLLFALGALLATSSAFAQSYPRGIRVLLRCTNTGFSDLRQIDITEDESDLPGAVALIEDSGRGSTYRLIDPKDFYERRSIELSGWYGYTRTLSKQGSSWVISHHDECSGGTSTVSCVENP